MYNQIASIQRRMFKLLHAAISQDLVWTCNGHNESKENGRTSSESVFLMPSDLRSESQHREGMEDAIRTISWTCHAKLCGGLLCSQNIFVTATLGFLQLREKHDVSGLRGISPGGGPIR